MTYWIGIDIGGSHVGGVSVDKHHNIARVTKVNLAGKIKKRLVMDELRNVLDELCRGEKVLGMGIGVPGSVKDGVMFWSCNSTFMEKTDFRKFASPWSKHVIVDNDVNCMAFGEMTRRKSRNLLAVTLGTGVGGGIVVDGRLHNKRPYAGEVGHMSIDPRGVKCTCGARGCFQEYVSVRGVMILSQKYLSRKILPEDIYVMARNGDRNARKVWEDYGKLLGLGLANLSNILDPEIIVLGGGISGAFDLFRDSMKKEMKKRLHMKPPEVVKGNEQAVAFGAACMAMKA